jgi:hypothetical protein
MVESTEWEESFCNENQNLSDSYQNGVRRIEKVIHTSLSKSGLIYILAA